MNRSLLYMPIVNGAGLWTRSSKETGFIHGLCDYQFQGLPVVLDHDDRQKIGEVIYLERIGEHTYTAVAETSLVELDFRQEASLKANAFAAGRNYESLVLQHVSLVESSATKAGKVLLTRQSCRPPGRPDRWSDREWSTLKRGWAHHRTHASDEYMPINDRWWDTTHTRAHRTDDDLFVVLVEPEPEPYNDRVPIPGSTPTPTYLRRGTWLPPAGALLDGPFITVEDLRSLGADET